jgi:ferredoxin
MPKYKIHIDRELCGGDKRCSEEAPATFQMDGEGKSVVINHEGDPCRDILRAARNCNMEAITLFDAETGRKVWPEG